MFENKLSIAAWLCLLASASCSSEFSKPLGPIVQVNPTDSGFSVRGKQLLRNGQPYRVLGLARPSLEWNPAGEMLSSEDFLRMKNDWRANTVRLSLNQGFLLAGSASYNPGYLSTLRAVVRQARNAGLNVILDLHWSDRGDLRSAPGQQCMADRNSLDFWRIVASEFKDDRMIMFELYNEPHDLTWPVWLSGGQNSCGFQSVGMQQLYDVVRLTGAQNVLLVAGLDYGYDLSGVPAHRIKGQNIAYVTHPYYGKEDWDRAFGFLAATDPVIATEFGDYRPDCTADYSSRFIAYAERNQISWTAWAWYVPTIGDDTRFCRFPALIIDWQGRPTAQGAVVKNALSR